MNCQEVEKLLDGYADGELDLVRTLEIEQHLRDCQECSRELQNKEKLRKAMSGGSLYYVAPGSLGRRVSSALSKTQGVRFFPRAPIWSWQGLAVALTLTIIISLSLIAIMRIPSADDQLTQELISSHVRSLMANHLTDVPSSDQHTVKPWFNGRLDFSPQVLDLVQQGFTLVGGRLDYIGNKPVAALVYQRRKHFINLYIWLSASDSNTGEKTWTRQGYNLIRWEKSDMTYWAVSDITLYELEEFAQAIQNPR